MSLNDVGFVLLNNFIDEDVANAIIDEAGAVLSATRGGGIRNADKKFATVAAFAHSEYMLSQAKTVLKSDVRLVRAILFDKTPENNWLVTWHQDKTVALSAKLDISDWGPWSIKDGVNHVQPPLAVLQKMVTFRVHLDASTVNNGCLKVIPYSQNNGILSQAEIYEHVKQNQAVTIEAPRLSALVMCPHLLHSSGKAAEPDHRRVLHLEFSSFQLPEATDWA